MTDLPEALRLADTLDDLYVYGLKGYAAAELRRLHGEMEKLRGEVARLTELHTLYQDKTERLKAERDALLADAEREKVAQWMIQRSYATGHGDTTEDLLNELEWQVRESERKACIRACEEDAFEDQFDGLGEAVQRIQARGTP